MQPTSREKMPERGRWYRLNVRLEEDEYRQFAQGCADLGLSPNTLIRDMIRVMGPNLSVVKELLAVAPQVAPDRIGEGLRRLLIEIYEERASANRMALEGKDGA